MSARRQARQRVTEPENVGGIHADLAAGPCIEIWADLTAGFPEYSARIRWKSARNTWAKANGLTLPADYRHLPRELRDRAPYYRIPQSKETT